MAPNGVADYKATLLLFRRLRAWDSGFLGLRLVRAERNPQPSKRLRLGFVVDVFVVGLITPLPSGRCSCRFAKKVPSVALSEDKG